MKTFSFILLIGLLFLAGTTNTSSSPIILNQDSNVNKTANLEKERIKKLIQQADLANSREKAIELLAQAIVAAQKNKNYYQLAADSYYKLADIYREEGDYRTALIANNEGLSFAEDRRDSKRLFYLLRQNGEIHLAREDRETAIAAYDQAEFNLRFDRRYTPTNNNILLFEIKRDANIFLREYITLLLESNQLERAIEILSTLKLSEFQAYFNDPCLDFGSNNAKETELVEGEIKVYSFITSNTTYLLVQKADKISLYPVNIKQEKIEELSQNYQGKLINFYSQNHKKEAQQLYDILIKPIAKDLAKSTKITFINDGILRTIPVGTWYDGKQYLFQKYLIDYSSGLNVPNPERRKVNRTLIAGSSIFQLPDLSPLPGVKNEINFLDKFIGKSLILLDREFTFKAVKEALSSRRYDTIHIATHGFFGGSVDNSFLAAYNQKIDLNQFSGILFSSLRRPFLLFLNGCKTAVGNSESPLGIAGVGLRARSANIIASLWDVRDDAAAQFAAEFYREYKSGKSIAEARRAAQLKLFENPELQHPSFWGAYIHITL